MKTKVGIGTYISIDRTFQGLGTPQNKILILLKGHFPIYKKWFIVCLAEQWYIVWMML